MCDTYTGAQYAGTHGSMRGNTFVVVYISGTPANPTVKDIGT